MPTDAELEEKVRVRAHEIWEEEGRPDGKEAEHWEKAATQVKAWELGKQTGKNPRGTDYRDKEDL